VTDRAIPKKDKKMPGGFNELKNRLASLPDLFTYRMV